MATRLLGYVPRSITDRASVIYFVQGPSGLIKIGLTTRLNRYLYDLMRANDGALILVGVMRGTTNTRRDIHNEFGVFRSHGDWFYPIQELVDYIVVNRDPRVGKFLETVEVIGPDTREAVSEAVELDWPVVGKGFAQPQPLIIVSKNFCVDLSDAVLATIAQPARAPGCEPEDAGSTPAGRPRGGRHGCESC